jgi:hypothetical protein
MRVLGDKHHPLFSRAFPRAAIAYAVLCVAAVIVLIGSALVGG